MGRGGWGEEGGERRVGVGRGGWEEGGEESEIILSTISFRLVSLLERFQMETQQLWYVCLCVICVGGHAREKPIKWQPDR